MHRAPATALVGARCVRVERARRPPLTETPTALAGWAERGQVDGHVPKLAALSRSAYGPAVTCEFCRSPRARWRYPASRDWLACDECHAAIQADDREALLGRVMLAPVP